MLTFAKANPAKMSQKEKIVETPLMKQYFEAKEQYPDAILLFRVGDFYETFADDALVASKTLGIVLTRRANGSASSVPLAGFPHHALDVYLPKLVRSGYKVAVCDQLEDPKLTKKLVRRGITELVTPGVAYSDQLLRQRENNFLAAVFIHKENAGVAFLDISTGTYQVAEGNAEYVSLLLSNFDPKEILVERDQKRLFEEKFVTRACITEIDEWTCVFDSCYDALCRHFSLTSLKGFGIEHLQLAVTAAGAILHYLEITRHDSISNICGISRIDRDSFVWMDRFTVRNLEVFQSLAGAEGVSLLDVVDHCVSAMGSRRLREWLSMPLLDAARLEKRYDVVSCFLSDDSLREGVRAAISDMGDMERIVSRAAAGRIQPREMLQLARALKGIIPVREACRRSSCAALKELSSTLDPCPELHQLLERGLAAEPAAAVGKGKVVAEGVDAGLDDLRNIMSHGKDILLSIQQREADRTGIPSLKISYNNVFGYYLEVRNTHRDKVPSDWIRKQTLVNAERYITEELKNYEEQILGAEEKALAIEAEIYRRFVEKVQQKVPLILSNAAAISKIDVLSNFAQVASERNYCRPKVDDGDSLEIVAGRHPVIETMMGAGEQYVANDLRLDRRKQQIIILTGPNMAGKSALLRQTALIALLAQTGSFVPAQKARIGLVDKIFTRVGASDNISRGESTFMVEMYETSTILHNLSGRSLVLLDEIGRGTSTYDGMSIAWAIVQYLHETPFRPRTLFATHYHELNEIEKQFKRVRNYHIATRQVDGKVIFLRRLEPGGVAHSFGIHVARMAGMPQEVVSTAEDILSQLEQSGVKGATPKMPVQLSLYQLEDPLLSDLRDELRNLDINSLSPLDAFDTIREMKRKMGI